MHRVASLYEGVHGGKVTVSVASSGTLARQLIAGATADVFVSASRRWMDHVDERGLLAERQPFLGNQLVLVAPADSGLPTVHLERGIALPEGFQGRLALGDPMHVPAGRYAVEALEWLGWGKSLSTRLAPGQSVKAALRFVEVGEVELGVVFRTDALAARAVKTLAVFPDGAHAPIEYLVGLVRGRSESARALYAFITNDSRARDEYERLGFDLRR